MSQNNVVKKYDGEAITLLSAVTATGAGSPAALSGEATFQAVANGTSGAYSATVDVEVSNDGTNFTAIGTISLSGTATTAANDVFVMSAPYKYVRGNVTAISGTGANVSLYMGV